MAPHRPPPHAASPVAASDGLCASNGACFQACACPCQASVLFRSAAGHWPPVACSGPDTLTVVFKVDDVGGPHGLGVRSLHSVLAKTRVSPPLSPAPSERPATFPSPLETGPQRAETTRRIPGQRVTSSPGRPAASGEGRPLSPSLPEPEQPPFSSLRLTVFPRAPRETRRSAGARVWASDPQHSPDPPFTLYPDPGCWQRS